MAKYKRSYSLLIVFLIMSMLVVGCSSSKPQAEPDKGSKPAESSTPAASDVSEIPIGILTSYSGEMGSYGKSWYQSAKLAFDQMNAIGGPLGKKIKVMTEDDQSSVEAGIRAARKLITANKCVTIVGMISDVLLGAMDFARENKVVLISPTAGSTKLDNATGNYIYRVAPSDVFDGIVSADALWNAGYKEIALLYENDEGRQSVARAVKAAYTKLGGKILTEVTFNPRQATYQAELKKVFDTNPPIVWLAAGVESGSAILKEWKTRGYSGKWMTSVDMVAEEMFKLLGNDTMNGIWGEMNSAKTDTPEFKKFSEDYKKIYGEEPLGQFMANFYDAAVLVGLAIEKGGAPSGEAIEKAMKEVAGPPGVVVHSFEEGVAEIRKGNDINYEGVSGPCDFDKLGNVSGSYVLLEARDGKYNELKFFSADELAKLAQ